MHIVCLRFIFLFIFFSFFKIQPLPAQDFAWPTDASRLITSSFAEYRSDHLHAGIDIKTWGREGYPVFAIGDGSIVEIRVSPYGYGRVLFLYLDSGYTAVYGHLSEFSDPFKRIVREAQKQQGKFAVTCQYPPDLLKVQKHQVIGKTGRTGTRVPHLHFEIRDSLNQPLNPLLNGFPVKDAIPPVLRAIAVTPLQYGSHVQGDFVPHIIHLEAVRPGIYTLIKTVTAWGKIGFALSSHDLADEASNKIHLYQVRLIVDDHPVFQVKHDWFPDSNTDQVRLDRDYRLYQRGKGLFQKLYKEQGNGLPFYTPDFPEGGVLCCWDEKDKGSNGIPLYSVDYSRNSAPVFLGKGKYTFRIEAVDYAGNLAVVEGILHMLPISDYKGDENGMKYSDHSLNNHPSFDEEVRFSYDFYQDYIYFHIQANHPFIDPPQLFLRSNQWFNTAIPLFCQNKMIYTGSFPLQQSMTGPLCTMLHYTSRDNRRVMLADTAHLFFISPEHGGIMVSPDGFLQVQFPPGAVYGPLWGTIQTGKESDLYEGSNLYYEIQPAGIPLKEKVELLFDVLNTDYLPEPMGVYIYNKDKGPQFIGNQWKDGCLTARTSRLGCFMALTDTVPPEIHFLLPGMNQRLSRPLSRIMISFQDTLSGIEGETNYMIKLNHVPLIVEYDPERGMGICAPDVPLENGRHYLQVLIRDRTGNIAEKTSYFTMNHTD